MNKIYTALISTILLAGCATTPTTGTNTADPLADLKTTVGIMDISVNGVGPLVVSNLCMFDAKDCATAQADLKAAQDSMVLVKAALADAESVNGANGTQDKVIAALGSVATSLAAMNQVGMDVNGKPLVSIPVVPVKPVVVPTIKK
jgi:hypothetical protein